MNRAFSIPLFSILDDIERDFNRGILKDAAYRTEWLTKAPSLVKSKYPSRPPMNHMVKADGTNVLEISASGIEKEDLVVEVENNSIIITDNSAPMEASDNEADLVLHCSLVTGGFPISIKVADTLDIDNFTAKLKNGILTIKIPPKPEVKPERKQISIA